MRTLDPSPPLEQQVETRRTFHGFGLVSENDHQRIAELLRNRDRPGGAEEGTSSTETMGTFLLVKAAEVAS